MFGSKSKLAAAASLTFLTACPDLTGKSWEESQPEPASTDSYTGECYWDWSIFADFTEPMYAVCIHGTHPDDPPDITLSVPCQAFGLTTNPSTVYTTYETHDETNFMDEQT